MTKRLIATSLEVEGRRSICKDWTDEPLSAGGNGIPADRVEPAPGLAKTSIMRSYDNGDAHIVLPNSEIEHLLAISGSGWAAIPATEVPPA